MNDTPNFDFTLLCKDFRNSDAIMDGISTCVGQKRFLYLNDFDCFLRNDIEMKRADARCGYTWSIPKSHFVIRYVAAIIMVMNHHSIVPMTLLLSINGSEARIESDGRGNLRTKYRDTDKTQYLEEASPTSVAKDVLEGM